MGDTLTGLMASSDVVPLIRVLVLSDIHGNVDALEAVYADACRRETSFDEIWDRRSRGLRWGAR